MTDRTTEREQHKIGAEPDTITTPDPLPTVLPIFPLTGAVLLPQARLPLNIFEPRYLSMTRDALKGSCMIGMIQPREQGTPKPQLFTTGCAGMITAHSETDDGRILMTLTGLRRFQVMEELPVTTPYRQVRVDWSPFASDLQEADSADSADSIDLPPLITVFEAFLKVKGLETDMEAIRQTPSPLLINMLSMILPFDPAEKQALLEAETVVHRADTLVTLMQMSLAGERHPESRN